MKKQRLTGVCPTCGGPKDKKSKECLACFAGERLSQKVARVRVPRQCACGRSAVPSPWHCFCKRWKTSDALFCETCAA